MNFKDIYEWVNSFKHIEPMSIAEKTAKISEEVGEFTAEILRLLGHKKQKYTEEELRDHILEEGCDIIITVLPIFTQLGFTEEQIIEKMKLKVNTWLGKINGQEYIKE
jgi:predicted house-cleaning noncanonical NTP pyrophosphatase (MazG superfamily)